MNINGEKGEGDKDRQKQGNLQRDNYQGLPR